MYFYVKKQCANLWELPKFCSKIKKNLFAIAKKTTFVV